MYPKSYYAVIKTDSMKADWFLKNLEYFISACHNVFDDNIFYGARLQHFNKGVLAQERSKFFCNDPVMNDRGYILRLYSDFTTEFIRLQWENKDHWEIEFYIFGKRSKDLLLTFAFYTYAPAIEIRLERTLHAESAHKILSAFLPTPSEVIFGNDTIHKQRELMAEGLKIPISDSLFNCLRRA